MKSLPTEDDAFGKGSIRADGRGVFPSYLLEVKTPAESTGEWDLYKVLATSPASRGASPAARQVQVSGDCLRSWRRPARQFARAGGVLGGVVCWWCCADDDVRRGRVWL
jgi:hypothetical protein